MAFDYQPPFHMTEEITNLIIEIGEYVDSISTYESMHQDYMLRRQNKFIIQGIVKEADRCRKKCRDKCRSK